MKTVLDLNYNEARGYFLQQEHYCNIELPPYFQFQPLLNALSKCPKLEDKKLIKNTVTHVLRDYERNASNYEFYSNKDSILSWRPFQLINPVAYVYLVNRITRRDAWRLIQSRFRKFYRKGCIECTSIPLVINGSQERGHSINNWLTSVEERSTALSLEYNYMLSTDIANCYNSIYTHSFSWALHGKNNAKEKQNRNNMSLVGNVIDRILQDISYGQTNGIPQGSTMMDFLAEIILGYIDYQLAGKLSSPKSLLIGKYKILRYRDDYRIFTEEKSDALKIANILSELLASVNMSLNTQKTLLSENIIQDALKSDKLPWANIPQDTTIRKRLLQIHDFATKFPNSGSIDTALFDILEDLTSVDVLSNDAYSLICILADIAFKNPRTYSKVAIALGLLLPTLPDLDEKRILPSINAKFSKMPNTEYLHLWLQRLSLSPGVPLNYNFRYNNNYGLCQYVTKVAKGLPPKKLWEYKCFEDDAITFAVESNPIVSKSAIKLLPTIPTTQEVNVFNRY